MIPTSYLSQAFHYHNNSSMNWNIDENLKVFVPDESDPEKSINIFMELYSLKASYLQNWRAHKKEF